MISCQLIGNVQKFEYIEISTSILLILKESFRPGFSFQNSSLGIIASLPIFSQQTFVIRSMPLSLKNLWDFGAPPNMKMIKKSIFTNFYYQP